jgi:two-component system NtrC family sensor kinase
MKNKPSYRFIQMIILIMFTKQAFSDTVVIDSSSLFNIGKRIYILEDKSNELTFEEVNSPSISNKFMLCKQDVPNIGITESTYWFRFDAINASGREAYLEISNSNINQINIYKIRDGNLLAKHSAGSEFTFGSRLVRNNKYYFPLFSVNETQPATFYLRMKYIRGLQFSIRTGSMQHFMESSHKTDFMQGIYFGIMGVMLLYNFILFLSIRDRSYLYYIFYIFSMSILNGIISGYAFEYLWPNTPMINNYADLSACFAGLSGILFATHFLNTKENTPVLHKFFQGISIFYILISGLILIKKFYVGTILMESLSLMLIPLFFLTAFKIMLKGYKPAKFFLIAWSLLLASVVIFILKDYVILPINYFTDNSMQFGSAMEAALLSFALADRINIYKKEKEKSQAEYLYALEENRNLVMNQNIMLEEQVEIRTRQLAESHQHIMRQESLASLGQLTAGIAHEIKNPINFVNNFSDVSGELVDEIMSSDNNNKKKEILIDLRNNLHKISDHGKRADRIVNTMLQFIKNPSDKKILTDISKLCMEYLDLSYNGFHLAYPGFTCEIHTHFQEDLPFVNINRFDIGRVLLNLFNNSFYSVQEKSFSNPAFKPVLKINTILENNSIVIRISDNGKGIPENIRDKIFNPFFTTKPSGHGMGLGLSLSYDIIKNHSGEIFLENSSTGETTFIISLNCNENE